MAIVITQESIDYINQANKRVAADTRILKKRVSSTQTASVSSVALDAEVVRIEAVYVGSTKLQLIGIPTYLETISQSETTMTANTLSYTVIGRTLYFWPSLSVGDVLTLIYSYRPSDITSTTTFTLTGMAERLVERLSSAYFLLDDGQPELAQRELSDYLTDMTRLKRRDGRREGDGGLLPNAKRRRKLV